MRNMKRSRRAAALLAAAAMALAGCSGGGSSGLPADEGGVSIDTGDGVKLGILGECEGPFGGFHEDAVGGVSLAMVNHAGATVESTTTALDGFSGAEVGGTPIELVGIGCAADTADRIVEETRRLGDQLGAKLIVGHASG